MELRTAHFLLFSFCIILFCSFSKEESSHKRIQLALREVGHSFLLQLGDSTSLVKPIEKEGERYSLSFSRPFTFEPSLLSEVVHEVLMQNKLYDHFLVEVESCDIQMVVHSFSLNSVQTKKEIACKGRYLAEDCYVFYFSELEPNISLHKEDQEAQNELNYWVLLLLIIPILIFSLKRWNKKVLSQEDGINLGHFLFNPKRLVLKFGNQLIDLSVKEADLLLLFYENESKTLERAFILNQIWGDEGDYVGRTLDVFISKLRKKIASDNTLQIINVRGVGYRFVISD